MDNEPFECSRTDCNVVITHRKTFNQKYCSDECCRIQTNRRIMEKYYAKKDQRQGKTRYCIKCNETKLSRYNDGKVCSSCEMQSELDINKSVREMLGEYSGK